MQRRLIAAGRPLVRSLPVAVALSFALASPAGAKTLVRYEKSGGIAGIQVTMTVTGAGAVRVTRSRSHEVTRFMLTAAQRRALARALRDARVATLHSAYAPGTPIADGFVQTIGYAGRRVTVRDGARPPARLRSLLTRLGGLAARER